MWPRKMSGRAFAAFVLLFALFTGLASAGLVGCNSEPEQVPQPPRPTLEDLTVETRPLQPGASTALSVEATVTGDAALEYAWEVDDEAWSIEQSGEDGAEATLTAPESYGASVKVSVSVSADGTTVAEDVTVKTVDNQGPRIAGISASPNPVKQGGTLTLLAQADDENGDELSYAWSTEAQSWELQASGGQEVELKAPDEGDVSAKVKLTVTDGHGGEATGEVLVGTRKNGPPVVGSLTASPPQVEPAGETTLTVSASDPDGDELSYSWTAPEGWELAGEGTSAEVKLTAPDVYGAEGKVQVEVTDGTSTTSASVLVSTRQNNGPTIASLTASPATLDKEGESTLRVSASDPDGDMLSYRWAIDKPSWSINENGATAKLTAPNKPASQVTAEVTVTDADGKSAKASVVVSTRANRAPSLAAITANPTTVAPGGTIDVGINASDPDGDTLTYSWNVPKDWRLADNGSKGTLTAPSYYGASGRLSVTVKDGLGGQVVAGVQVATTQNQPPTVASVTADPPVIQPKGTSTIEVNAADPNGDALTYKWTVPQGWTEQTTGKDGVIKVTAPDKTSASARIVVEVSDGHGGKASGAVVVRTPLNQPPRIQSLTAGSGKLQPGDTRKLSASVFDPEGDSLSYTWKLPKGWSGSSNTSSIDVTAPRDYGTTYTFTLEVSDGSNTSTKKVSLTMVDNQQPTIASLKLSENPIKPGQSLTATTTATDPLGDPLTYKWSIQDNTWSISGSGASVQVTAPGQASTTQLTVTVEDGFGGTATESVSVESRPALYSFTKHRFTNCGKTGTRGPSVTQCRSSYNTGWDSNGQFYSVSGPGVQVWTVPQDGKYRIVAAGARGGYGTQRSGAGKGAIMRGTFTLKEGQKLRIGVGQHGQDAYSRSSYTWGGGGGASYVFDDQNQPFIVAAGGHGSADGRNNYPRQAMDASAATSNNPGGGNGPGSKGDAGGYNGAGRSWGQNSQALVNGGIGANQSSGPYGGFGGGGSGRYVGQGAGGGYEGGGGADAPNDWNKPQYKAKGYNTGSNQQNTVGNDGHGYVEITRL